MTATSKDGNKAELQGKEKAQAATAESFRKKLFEGKRQIDKVRVTVRKTGNSYGIISIAPQNPGWPPKIPHLWPLENPPPAHR